MSKFKKIVISLLVLAILVVNFCLVYANLGKPESASTMDFTLMMALPMWIILCALESLFAALSFLWYRWVFGWDIFR